MEITKDNFDEALEIVSNAIKQCDLMAFDTEFTGFSISEEDRGHISWFPFKNKNKIFPNLKILTSILIKYFMN